MTMLVPEGDRSRDSSARRPTERQVRAELARILQDPDFQASPRSAALLTHIVEKALAGRQAEIKESTIGVEVFQRRPDYNPREDAIVRSEARRLREKLNRHNLNRGNAGAVRIEVPRGSYQPAFHMTEVRAEPAGGRGWLGRASMVRWITSGIVLAGAVGLSAVSPWRHEKAVPALAVLPFAYRAANPNLQYLTAGLSEDLERDLARVKGLRIHAAPSAGSLEPRPPLDYQALGRKLGVSALLDGEVSGTSGRSEVAVSLVRASDRSVLWADRFPCDGDIRTAERQIEQATAAALGVKLLDAPPRENAQAHDLFLRGRNLWASRRRPETEQAIALFEQALRIDPHYALAYMGIADAYGLMAANGQIDSSTAISRGLPAALKAIELDPALAEAHAALGLLRGVQWDWKAQDEEYQRAIALNPNYDKAYLRAGVVRFELGDFAGADRLLRESETLNPTALSLPLVRAELYYYWRRYDDSINLIRQVQQVDRDPKNGAGYLILARDFLQLHKTQEAEEAARKVSETDSPATAQVALAPCLAAAGKPEKAAAMMRNVIANRARDPIDPYTIALAFARVEDKANTLAWLETALDERTPDLISARWDPALDFVRGEPRYQAVVKTVFAHR